MISNIVEYSVCSVYLFCKNRYCNITKSIHGKNSFKNISKLLQIFNEHGFHNRSKRTIRMKLSNYQYLEEGTGFSHASKQSKSVHMNNKETTI